MNSTQVVQVQAKMEEHVITRKLGMELRMVVVLRSMQLRQLIILNVGANNYFLLVLVVL